MNAPFVPSPLPAALAPRTRRIFLEGFDVPVDIGFHDFEIGTPQRLLVSVEVWVEESAFPTSDIVAEAWNYDFLRTEILALSTGRRFNLQESFVHEIYAVVAARPGVKAIRVSSRKPDVYPDCAAVGVDLASF